MALRYFLALSRPRFWLYLAGPVLVGLAWGASSLGGLLAPLPVALFCYFLLPANVFLYGVNDVFDRDVDAANPKKEGREARYDGQTWVPWMVVACAGFGLAFLPFLPRAAWPAMLGFLVLGAAYSAPPVRFKTTPLLDSVSNGLYALPGVVAFATVTGHQPPVLAVLGGWLWTMGMHTFSAIPDIEADRDAGIATTATALGDSATYWYCGACWLAAAVAWAFLAPLAGLLFAVYPVFLLAIRLGDVAVSRAYWWFPVLNALAGMALTLPGLWRLARG